MTETLEEFRARCRTFLTEHATGIGIDEVTDPRGLSIVRTEYDAQGRAYRQFNGEGETMVEIVYNPDGTATVLDGLGNSSIHGYDSRNTLTGEIDALGGTDSKVYDFNFRPTKVTDATGDITQLTWSEDGANLTQVIDAEGNRVDLTYDELNNLTDVIDPKERLEKLA